MIRVFIADDHSVVRRGIINILSDSKRCEILGEAASIQELWVGLERAVPDVLVLDLSLPDRSGLAVISELKEKYPAMKILVLSVHPEEQYTLRSLKEGASGYLSKECAPEDLLTALETIIQTGTYLSPRGADLMAAELRRKESGQDSTRMLSGRETEVLECIAKGKTLTEIAEVCSLSLKTVSTYRTRILKKLNLSSNADLVRYVINNSLFTA